MYETIPISFRQFTVHRKNAMKVGTDAVLLGSWVQTLESTIRILDIGTGTGLIALMLAQKSDAVIDAMDVDEGAFYKPKKISRISPLV